MAELAGAETIAANRYLYAKLSPEVAPAKVYPAIAERASVMPYVLFQYMPRPGERDTTALGGIRVLARLRFLVKVLAPTLTEAEPLVKAVDAALQDTEGPQSGYYVSNVRRVEPFELPTVDPDGAVYWQTGGYYDLDVSAGV